METSDKHPWRIEITNFEFKTADVDTSLLCKITNNEEFIEFINNTTSSDETFFLNTLSSDEYIEFTYKGIEYFIMNANLRIVDGEFLIDIIVAPSYREIESNNQGRGTAPGEDAFWDAHYSGDYSDMGGF